MDYQFLLRNLIHKFSENESLYKSSAYSEANCRLEFLDLFLNILGWDVQNKSGMSPYEKDVIVELPSDGEHHDKPDYTLTIMGMAKVFVEAKKPSVDITSNPKPALQCRRYGWNAGHRISVLTNFEYLAIYDTTIPPKNSDSADVALYQKFYYKDYLDKIRQIRVILSKDSIIKGSFDKWAQGISGRTEYHKSIDEAFLEEIDGWRKIIANELYSMDGKYHDLELLNLNIQSFINRMVFLRICEDKEIYRFVQLKNVLEDDGASKAKLLALFHNADVKFSSGLFSGDGIAADMKEGTIKMVIGGLYYPQVSYLFNVITPHILGKIYESYLSERLVFEDGKVVLAKKKEYKDRSIVTTPEEVVSIITRTVTEEVFKGKKPDQILNLSFLDPACGSGIFLESIFDRVSERLLDLGLGTSIDKSGNLRLPMRIKRMIAENCLFGVDIDKQACEVTKFSLLIKILDGETYASLEGKKHILPDLSLNILCGNSLIERKDLQSDCSPYALLKINPFSWSSIHGGKPFDAIVCNPPYMKTEDMVNILPSEELEAYKRKYLSAKKMFDKYFAFIEQSTHLLSAGGLFGCIVPNKYLKIDTAKALRGLLLPGTTNVRVLDFGSSQLFEDKTIYSCLTFWSLSSKNKFSYSLFKSITAALTNKPVFSIADSQTIGSEWITGKKFCCPNDQKFVPLLNFAKPINGIQTSQEKPNIYWFSDSETKGNDSNAFHLERDGMSFLIEKAIVKPYFKPISAKEKSLTSYDEITTDKHIIFPYHSDGTLIGIDELSKKYKGCWEYLCHFKSVLMPKQLDPSGHRDVPSATPDTWYQFGRDQNFTAFFGQKKIIVKNMFKDNQLFALDDRDFVISSGGTAGYSALVLLPKCKMDIRFLQAYLNCSVNLDIIRRIGSDFDNGFTAIGTTVLKKLYVPKIDYLNESSQSFALYEDIISLVKRINAVSDSIANHLTNYNISQLRDERAKTIALIDKRFRDYLCN